MDFQERLVDDIALELLEKTCHLTRLPPVNAKSSHCPNVSMAEFCSGRIDFARSMFLISIDEF